MTAEELMQQGGQYYRLSRDAQTEKDRAYWVNRLDICIHVSREEFGTDVWVTKELEGLRDELSALRGNAK